MKCVCVNVYVCVCMRISVMPFNKFPFLPEIDFISLPVAYASKSLRVDTPSDCFTALSLR